MSVLNTRQHGNADTSQSVQSSFQAEIKDASMLSPYPNQRHISDHYDVIGFISSGTYGRVYKAKAKAASARHAPTSVPDPSRTTKAEVYAIKKFKPDKEGELQYSGISQSAVREMALCTELSHENVIHLVEIILEAKCIFMIFEYAEHDLLQIVHWHTQHPRTPVASSTLRSIMYQLLNGLVYLHQNWVMHRDLKPANIMVSSSGQIKIGDLGLARLFQKPLQALFSGDKVVVTIWYRAPELLLGSRHYTPAIDLWAVGCIFAELLSLRPIFKGEEAKQDNKKSVPYQRNQMSKIIEIMGVPRKENWRLLSSLPEFNHLPAPPLSANLSASTAPGAIPRHIPSSTSSSSVVGIGIDKWWDNVTKGNNYNSSSSAVVNTGPPPNKAGLELLRSLLEYDPAKRLTAAQALAHAYFETDEEGHAATPGGNCFEGGEVDYPQRKVSSDDNDIKTSSLPGTKRSGLPDDLLLRSSAKRLKDM